jgi:hypothetical protein
MLDYQKVSKYLLFYFKVNFRKTYKMVLGYYLFANILKIEFITI